MDWNVFFSTYAQASAAIIGIIAAFTIAKLITENGEYETLKMNLII
ncbi:MAG: hypothetical protein JW982_04465 [Spirochaetes bacterium]|nr:hypothetical protein [Spirochaetota bacterium]